MSLEWFIHLSKENSSFCKNFLTLQNFVGYQKTLSDDTYAIQIISPLQIFWNFKLNYIFKISNL